MPLNLSVSSVKSYILIPISGNRLRVRKTKELSPSLLWWPPTWHSSWQVNYSPPCLEPVVWCGHSVTVATHRRTDAGSEQYELLPRVLWSKNGLLAFTTQVLLRLQARRHLSWLLSWRWGKWLCLKAYLSLFYMCWERLRGDLELCVDSTIVNRSHHRAL